jgi:hypothetical protein
MTDAQTEPLEFYYEATLDESLGAYIDPDIREVASVMPYGDYIWHIETAPAWNIEHFFDGDPTDSKARDKMAAREKLYDKAPLSAATGRVVAVGFRDVDSGNTYIFSGESVEWEKTILQNLYWLFQTEPRHWYGFNSIHFDLSFIVRRGYVLGLNPPSAHSLKARHTDLLDLWRCGDRREYVSMDTLATAMGLTRKNGDGAMFWRNYMKGGEERQKALAYLVSNLQMTQEIYERMT